METSEDAGRPVGITLLAGVFGAAAIGSLMIGVVFLVAPQLLEPHGFGANPGFGRRMLGLAFNGLVAAILGVTARGLWALRRESRSYTIALACGGPAWLLGKVSSIQNGSIGLTTIVAILASSAVVLAYLMSPAVRSAFRHTTNDTRG